MGGGEKGGLNIYPMSERLGITQDGIFWVSTATFSYRESGTRTGRRVEDVLYGAGSRKPTWISPKKT